MLGAAFFASAEPVLREVKLGDGTVHALHFKQLPAGQFRTLFTEAQDSTRAVKYDRLIAACLCTAEGEPVITAEQAETLTPIAWRALADAALDVNGMGDAGNG